MLLDKQNEFADSQAITVDAISTNVIDTLPMTSNPNTVQNLGGINAAFLIIQVDTAFTAAGAATLTITLESDSTANLATSPTVHWSSPAIAKATLIAGYQLIVPMPIGHTYERYLGLRYTIATGPMTAGALSAFISRDIQTWRPYATASASNA